MGAAFTMPPLPPGIVFVDKVAVGTACDIKREEIGFEQHGDLLVYLSNRWCTFLFKFLREAKQSSPKVGHWVQLRTAQQAEPEVWRKLLIVMMSKGWEWSVGNGKLLTLVEAGSRTHLGASTHQLPL
jgi:hypothetical protein